MVIIKSYGVVPFLHENEQWKVLLILHREGNHWGFPKGKANDQTESPEQAAKRELKEETGLDIVELLPFDPYTEQYQFRRKADFITKTVTYFPAIVGGELLLQEEEIRDAKWLSIKEALDQLSFKEAQQILLHYVQLLNIRI